MPVISSTFLNENNIKMNKFVFYFLLSASTYCCSILQVAAQTVSGHVDAPRAVKQLVVYLEATGSERNGQTQTHVVSQKDTEFHSPLTVITVGDKIQWTNDEDKEIDHNIFSLSSLAHFDLGLGERGSKLEQAFNQVGVVNYYCSVHKKMEGKAIVLPNRYYQSMERPGDFKIDNVPEGDWTLNAVVLHLRYKAEPVKFTVGNAPVTNLILNIVKK